MTLEEKIMDIYDGHPKVSPVWKTLAFDRVIFHYSYPDVLREVMTLIEEADEAECLTSSIKFVREYKKYYQENGRPRIKTFY